MADIIYIDVDPDGGGDYTAIKSAIEANETNLVTADEIHWYRCTSSAGTADTLADAAVINFDGYTCDATRYIVIEGMDDHGGVFDTGSYRVGHSGSGYGAVFFESQNNDLKIKFLNLQIMQELNDAYDRGIFMQPSAGASIMDVEIDRCILRGDPAGNPSTANKEAIMLRDWPRPTTTNFQLRNTLIYGWSSGVYCYTNASNLDQCDIYNNTIVNNDDFGLNNDSRLGSNLIVKNNVFTGNDGGEEIDDATTGTFDYNATEKSANGRGTNGFSIGAYTLDQVFTTPASNDFHAETTGPLYQQGVDLSTLFTDDIDGETRASTWTIGADDPDGTSGGGDALTAQTVTSGVPTVGQSTIGQVHGLASQAATAGAPTVEAPSIGQIHELASQDATAGVPTVDQATIALTSSLTAQNVEAAAPTVEQASIGQQHALASQNSVTAAATVDQPDIGQEHALAAQDIASAAPTVDQPTAGVAGGTDALAAADAVSGDPVVGQAVIGQIHSLTAQNVASAAATVDKAALAEIHALQAQEIAAGVAEVGAATLGQVHALGAQAATSGAATVDQAVLGQIHALEAQDATSGVPEVSGAYVGSGRSYVSELDILVGSGPVSLSAGSSATLAVNAASGRVVVQRSGLSLTAASANLSLQASPELEE